METQRLKLKSLLTIKNGKDHSALEPGIYPVIGSGGVMRHANKFLYSGESVLLPRKGTLSNIQYINDSFWTVDTCYYTEIKKNVVLPYYLYAVLRSFDLSGLDSGASIPSMTAKTYYGIKLDIPTLSVQKRIVSILSAYDDLIDNNNKRIKILEKMAENLYKEWFSYKNIKKSAEYTRLSDILQIVRGISYSSDEINVEEGLNLINLKNIESYGGFRQDGTKKYDGKYKPQQVVCCGDLVMGVTDMTQDRRTVGSVAIVPKLEGTSVISADLIKISSSIDNLFLYAMFKYGKVSRHIAQFANGANVLHLKPQDILKIKVLLPKDNLIGKYVGSVAPMFHEMEKLNLMNANLIKQRDLLLPRLMSGKLEV